MKRGGKLLLWAGSLIILMVGCGQIASLHSDLNVADVNARNAIYKADQLAGEVSSLEGRVDDLEKQLGK